MGVVCLCRVKWTKHASRGNKIVRLQQCFQILLLIRRIRSEKRYEVLPSTSFVLGRTCTHIWYRTPLQEERLVKRMMEEEQRRLKEQRLWEERKKEEEVF